MQTIFGSQFFNFDVEISSPGTITETFNISSRFWTFWVVLVPLTMFVLAIDPAKEAEEERA
jgi:hypothetical protein